MTQGPWIRTALLFAVMGLAACGGEPAADGVASVNGGGATVAASVSTGVTDPEQARKFAACMRENGVPDFPDPGADGQFDIAQLKDSGLDLGKVQDGLQECRALAPNGGQRTQFDAGQQEQLRQFAQCMRDNGVDMPDPDPNGGGFGLGAGAAGIDRDDPAFQKGLEACQDKLTFLGVGRWRMSRKSRARVAAGVGGGALVIAAATAATVGFGDGDAATAGRGDLPPATATVTRTTLTETETVDGTLGYGDTTVVKARGTTPATVTWLPATGRVVSRGEAVYRADGDPVVLLYGSSPLYRTLAPGSEGADVRLVEKNLSALGYDGFTVDGEYTSATADVVRDWQDDLGLPETGTVAPGQFVVAAGRIRVTSLQLAEGDTASGPVLGYTGTTRSVTVHLDVDKQELVSKGTAATVELPGGDRVKGTVTAVGTVATTSGADNQETTTIEVSIAITGQKALGTLDEAPVDVVLESEQRRDVLAVPVNALVALAEGGYGLQVVDGTATRYVAVETGLFAGGKVEVSGSGVTDGLVVGVPK